ncbi:PIR protein [Plasmodium vivax]|uniref:VIR protein n=1 Tax=Plasmodium vivax TaxID=5855 RepID=A0A565A4F9_PLAVI|nr:PIR protein [Plasmodium vivax]
MAGDEETYKLNDFIVGNNKLNKSNLNRFYKSYFETACENREIFNDYCSQVAKLDTLPSHLRELYRKFERNLILIWDDKKKAYDYWETDKNALCSYLKYWIYDQLISKDVSQDNFLQFFNLWNARKNEKCSNCECEFNIKHFSQVKMLKKAYDYSLFLKAYKKTAKINKQIYNMNYCRYVEDAKAIYTLLGDTCEKSTAENCKEFNKYVLPYVKYKDSGRYKFVEENEDTEVDEDAEKGEDDSAISCKVHLTTDPDIEEGHRRAKEIIKELDALKEKTQEENDQLEGAEEDADLVPEARGDDTQRVQTQRDLLLSLRLEDPSAGHVLHDTLPVPEPSMISTGLDTGSDGNGSSMKTITSASLVGVPSIIFLLYKFSPVRTWLDPRIRKTKSDLRNSIQGSNELQSHDYNFDTTNMDFNRINVGYQSR